MIDKLKEIKFLNPQIKTKYVVADFGELNSIKQYREIIGE